MPTCKLYNRKWEICSAIITIMLVSFTSSCSLGEGAQQVQPGPTSDTATLSTVTPALLPKPTDTRPVPAKTQTFPPTPTATQVSTKTPAPTPTVTWTLEPLVTLSQEDVIRELDYLNESENCRLPCWHGLTPGVSNKDDMPIFLRTFGIDTSSKELELEGGYYHLGGSVPNYPKFPSFPQGRQIIQVLWKDDTVEVIEIQGVNPKYAFDTDRIVSILGMPGRMLVFGGLAAPYTFGLALDYPRQNILIDVGGKSRSRPGDYQFTTELCPWDNPYDYVVLYLYSKESKAQVMTWYNDQPWYDWAKLLKISTEELFGRLQSPNKCIPSP